MLGPEPPGSTTTSRSTLSGSPPSHDQGESSTPSNIRPGWEGGREVGEVGGWEGGE